MQRYDLANSISDTDTESQAIPASSAVKPLPPLPRGWSRVCHETGLFLRGIGLGIVVTSFQGLFTKNFSEPQKIAIRRSRITALLRTLIHAVPVGISIFEIVLNFKGHFVGGTCAKQNHLQFAAKAHEITMQASIATILFSYIRYQVSTGKGIPFGAILGGFQFLQVSYLWSVELWSSILSKEFQPRKKACFVALILICVAVSATAGPSSASLLIARQGLWPTPSTYLAVNASAQDLWPDRLDDKNAEGECAIVRLEYLSSYTPSCPISDLYTAVSDLAPFLDYPQYDVLSVMSLQNQAVDYEKVLDSSLCETSCKDQYCASVPQTKLMGGYYMMQLNHSVMIDLEAYQFMQKNVYQPYTIASCVADVVKDASDQTPLQFARISETESELKKDREIVSIPSLKKGKIVSDIVTGSNSNFSVGWVDLPMDVYNTGIPGAVIVNSQDQNGSSYNITTCTLNAGWGSSTVLTWSEQPTSIYSHMSKVSSSWLRDKMFFDGYEYAFTSKPNFANFSGIPYPQRRISISKNWMELLNPTMVLLDNSTGKYMSLVLSTLQSQPTERNMAQLLTMLLATALSGTGTEHGSEVFSDLKNATRSCDTCLVFEIEYWVHGWLYSNSGTTIRLAITVMLTYCALVFGHIIYSAISGVSSTAWDSAAELVALAMNSSPTKILDNTCAGIIGRRALKTSVRVLATTPGHLELVFGQVKDSNAQASNLVMNEKYGRLEGENDDGDEESGSNT